MEKPLRFLVAVCGVCAAVMAGATVSEPIRLWPSRAPGETKVLPREGDTTKPTDRLVNGKRIVRLGNVSEPTITIYSPDPAKNTGAAVIVAPGGGYSILASELEGTEVCEWLNSIGVTGVLLKYRVPKREERARHEAPLEDAQRAMGLVRSRAKEWGIDPQRIGMLGFSAGAHLTAVASHQHEKRVYERIDAADDVSCRPDFALLIYPAYLAIKEKNEEIAPELPVGKERTPPTFIVMTGDDPVRVENAVFYYLALKNAGVRAEMHLYPEGGHGYGLQHTEALVTTWPARAEEWMRSEGLLR
jgi:Esterase/lipase